MSGALAEKRHLTPEEYLEIERNAEIKSEYYDGEMFAMSGGTAPHSVLGMNLGASLLFALRGRRCTVFASDLRVHIPACGLYTYPDVSVVCGRPEFLDESRDTLLNPVLLVEVLSPSTERYDRGAKFAMYRRLTSLKEYVLVSQSEARVEVFRKNARDRWELQDFVGLEAALELESVGCTVPLSELYAMVEGVDPTLVQAPPPAAAEGSA